MCKIFSEIDPKTCLFETRSVRLGGHATSIRLEGAFWQVLEEIASAQDVSLGRFLTKLHDEVLEFRGPMQNFSSLLRCACLKYISEIKYFPDTRESLTAEARHTFASSRPIRPQTAVSKSEA
jgi:predicted DNA-binding ribbon-helix-helix protein